MKSISNRYKPSRARIAITTAIAMAAISVGASQTQAAQKPEASRYGRSIKVGIFDTFPGFCVSNNPANSALMAERSIYETLFERTKGGDMVGLLASGATSSADLKTWTITLRQGIKFTDGVDFDATAVLTNFNAITGRIAAAAYSAGGLAGYQTKAYTVGTGTAFTANIKAMTVKSQYVIEFQLDRAQNVRLPLWAPVHSNWCRGHQIKWW